MPTDQRVVMGFPFRRLRAALFFLLVFLPCRAWAWDAQVVSVHDGDTITVLRVDSGERVKIRLYGIDCPELPGRSWGAQPYSKKARNFLRGILPAGGRASVLDMGYDKYSRTVAGVVSLPDGAVVQEKLLEAGLAWVYPKYCPDCRQWRELERLARESGRGLWREKTPVPPWEWRRR